jgi:hypothetical protein
MMNEATSSERRVICPARRDTGVRLFIATAVLLGFGIYCFADWGNSKYDAPEAWDMKHINQAARYVLTYFGPFVFVPAGLVVAGMGIASMTRKLVADDSGIAYGRTRLAWTDVTSLDASELPDKQILSLRYGEDQSLALDAYKLQNFKELVAFVEEHVAPQTPREEATPLPENETDAVVEPPREDDA